MEYRLFKRYSIKHLPHQILTNTGDQLSAYNISLVGVSLIGPVGFSPEQVNKVTLTIADKTFELYVNLVWAEKKQTSKGLKISAGYKITMNDEQKFKKWLTFIRAIDKLYWKRQKKSKVELKSKVNPEARK